MKKCIYCSKEFDDQQSTVCPHCSKDNNVSRLTERGIHVLHQNAHNNITKYSEKKDSALVFIVVGLMVLIVAIVLFALAFKYDVIRIKTFRPNSVEFILSMILAPISLFCLSFGAVRLVQSILKIKFYKSVIKETERR